MNALVPEAVEMGPLLILGIVLIVTPEEHEQRHIEVLASLSAMISDAHVRGHLMVADDANEAWEVIESRELRSYNYFLEDDENSQDPPLRAATPPAAT